MTRRSPGTHSTNLYWPVPTGFLATWSPAACTAVGDIMNAFWSAVSVAAKGPSVVSSSVASSTTLTAVIGFKTAASGFLVFGSTKRSRLYLATVALNGEPSWNFTPWRSLKRQEVSLGVSHDVASAGWGASAGCSSRLGGRWRGGGCGWRGRRGGWCGWRGRATGAEQAGAQAEQARSTQEF